MVKSGKFKIHGKNSIMVPRLVMEEFFNQAQKKNTVTVAFRIICLRK